MTDLSSQELQEKIDKLVTAKSDRKEMLAMIADAYRKFPKDVEIVWRYSRVHFQVSEEADVSHRAEILRKGVSLAEEAIKLDKECGYGHKWWAINLASLGDFESLTEKIKNGFLIREHLDYSLKCNPDDATVLFAIGKWCFQVANVSGIARTIASTIFSAPPTSSFSESVSFFKKVEEILSDPIKGSYYHDLKIRNKIMIGDCYEAMKDYESAKLWYQLAKDQKVETTLDKVEHSTAESKLAKCGSSWFW